MQIETLKKPRLGHNASQRSPSLGLNPLLASVPRVRGRSSRSQQHDPSDHLQQNPEERQEESARDPCEQVASNREQEKRNRSRVDTSERSGSCVVWQGAAPFDRQ
jgi:hypothetical protein